MVVPHTSSTKAASRHRILVAARAVLKRQGYRRTSMDDIAQQAGLAKATLYLHFGGKGAIVRTMFEQCRAQIDERATAALSEMDDVAVALARVIEAHLGTAIDWFGNAENLRELSRLVADDPATFRIPPSAELDERLLNVLAAAEADGRIAPRKPDAARLLVDVLQDCANGAKQIDAIDAQEFSKRIRRASPVILDGLFTTEKVSPCAITD